MKAERCRLIYLFQFVKNGQPLVIDLIPRMLDHRLVELTTSQRRPLSFSTYRNAYIQLFPKARELVERWTTDLIERYGDDLSLCHYVAHVGSQVDGATSCVIRDNFREKFGEGFFVPSDNEKDLALGRVIENVLPGRRL